MAALQKPYRPCSTPGWRKTQTLRPTASWIPAHARMTGLYICRFDPLANRLSDPRNTHSSEPLLMGRGSCLALDISPSSHHQPTGRRSVFIKGLLQFVSVRCFGQRQHQQDTCLLGQQIVADEESLLFFRWSAYNPAGSCPGS